MIAETRLKISKTSAFHESSSTSLAQDSDSLLTYERKQNGEINAPIRKLNLFTVKQMLLGY